MSRAFIQGVFHKLAQEQISPQTARMLAEYISARVDASRKEDERKKSNPVLRVAKTVGGAGSGALAGAGVLGAASYLSRLLNKKPVGTGEAADQALWAARLGILPGAFIGAVTGASK